MFDIALILFIASAGGVITITRIPRYIRIEEF